MVQAITLPRVVVTRSAAEDLIESSKLSSDDDVVKVMARGVASSAQSFADELVQQLIARGYHTAVLLGAPRQLTHDLTASAQRAGKISVVTSAEELVAS